MAIDENTFHLISMLLKCRDAAKRIYGDYYSVKIKDYIRLIEKEQEKYGTDNPLEAAIDIAHRNPTLVDGGMLMLLMSAAIEKKPEWYE